MTQKTKNKCKYCSKKGVYGFSFTNSDGITQDKHVTCQNHVQLSISSQNVLARLDEMKQRMKITI